MLVEWQAQFNSRFHHPLYQFTISPFHHLTFHSCSEISRQNRRVRVDPSIAEEGPVATGVLDQLRIAHGGEDLGALARFGEDAAEGVGDERVAEELDALGARFILV